MTVKELIEELQNYNPDNDVEVSWELDLYIKAIEEHAGTIFIIVRDSD